MNQNIYLSRHQYLISMAAIKEILDENKTLREQKRQLADYCAYLDKLRKEEKERATYAA